MEDQRLNRSKALRDRLGLMDVFPGIKELMLHDLSWLFNIPHSIFPNANKIEAAIWPWFDNIKASFTQLEIMRICSEGRTIYKFISDNVKNGDALPLTYGIRLGKVVAHLCQWAEDYLNNLGYSGNDVGKKILSFLDKNKTVHNIAQKEIEDIWKSNRESYVINYVGNISDDRELCLNSLADLKFMRNATAHTIDVTMPIYKDADAAMTSLGCIVLAIWAIDTLADRTTFFDPI